MSYLKVGRPPRSREYLNSDKMYPYRGWYTPVVAFPIPSRLLNVFERISAVIFIFAERYGPGQPFSGWDMTRTFANLRIPGYAGENCGIRGEILENWRS